MSEQALSFRDYSLFIEDLIDLTPEVPPIQPQPQTMATREDVLAMLLASLSADDSPLFELIDDELADPSERGRTPRVHPMTAIRICRALTEQIMDALDQHAAMVQEVRHG
jgi:hypothetical protein